MGKVSVLWRKTCWLISALGLVATMVAMAGVYRPLLGPAVVAALTGLALAFMGYSALRSYAFTVWVFALVAASLAYPGLFGQVALTVGTVRVEFHQKILIVPLIQIIMFGMGTTLSARDFARVFAMPWPVLVGFVIQFTIMPLVGFTIASVFGFEREIAAGVVLIGSCPGGVASNVMTYLARGNVPLSVTMTACSTLASPIMTPLGMKILAGQYVQVDFVKMMMDICNMIIVPIVAGLVANWILYGRQVVLRRAASLLVIFAAGVAGAVGTSLVSAPALGALKSGLILGFALIAVVAAAKLVVDVLMKGPEKWMDRVLPIVSMAGICYIIAIITAVSIANLAGEDLLRVVPAVAAAAMLHNLCGYMLGYGGARLFGLNETDCRTVAIEVGLQNGGMASGLAMNTLHSVKAALAPAIFGPWMNVSGSVLATWWRRRPAPDLADS